MCQERGDDITFGLKRPPGNEVSTVLKSSHGYTVQEPKVMRKRNFLPTNPSVPDVSEAVFFLAHTQIVL